MASNWQNIVVQEGQSLFDIALQHYGNAEAVIDLVRDNGLQGITQQLQAGQLLLINTASERYNKAIVNYYRANGCLPATQQGVPFEERIPINIISGRPNWTYDSTTGQWTNLFYDNYLTITGAFSNYDSIRLYLTIDTPCLISIITYDVYYLYYGITNNLQLDIDTSVLTNNTLRISLMYMTGNNSGLLYIIKS